jgi:hypothetical protein
MTKRAETGVGDPRKRNYHPHHPMRVEGVMPHDMDGDGFIEYQILHGMTEGGYWLSVHAGQEQAEDWEANGVPVPTERLTDDQKGWAKADHYDHYTKEHARWRIHPGKSSKVTPATLRYAVHDLVYRDHCDCEEPKYVLWGHRWDLRPLHQCHNCGEVITKPPRIYHNNLIDNTKEQEHDDTDAEVLDQAQSDAA